MEQQLLNKQERKFYLFCIESQVSKYEAILTDFKDSFVFVDSIAELLLNCIESPPLGIFLDMHSITKLGSATVAPIFKMNMDWPIARCNLSPNGASKFMCVDLPHGGSIPEAVSAILTGDKSWKKEHWRRGALRISKKFRCRFRGDANYPWQHATALNVSVGGIFLVSYQDYDVGRLLEIEIYDLIDKPVLIKTQIRWAQKWDDGIEFPGYGLKFNPAEVSDELRNAIAGSQTIKELTSAL